MKTNTIFQNQINKRIITRDMLVECLYSVNKRAKNYRDKAYEYSAYQYDRYGYEEQYREKKKEFYAMKEKLLSIVQPTCIHVEYFEVRQRYYDYEVGYDEIKKTHKIIYQDFDYDPETQVDSYFVDVIEKEPHYYLFYDIGADHTFHTPIDNPGRYDLPIEEIDRLHTKGADIHDLISVQFVRKVINVIESGDYTYLPH
ncbi:MAG: hypothetical protein K6E32_07270 [Lachnospiraceae bacterium]|nr:hypothetical protein [Lachnospiraceae bacterium]